MPWPPPPDELLGVSSVTISRRRTLMMAAVAAALGAPALALLATTTQTRSALMSQLQRPADPAQTVGRGFSANAKNRGLRVYLTLGANRAGLRDPARLAVVGRGGRVVTGAVVTLSYSMPSMNMWHVYASRLTPIPGAPGSYGATQGVLGMAGRWRITVTVVLRGHRAQRFAISDWMRA
jgi:hypothetical protein